MNEWRSDWDQKMARPPFKERRFTADMMEDVEKRLENVRKKRNRRGRVRSAIIIVPVMLLVFGAGSIWIGDQTAHSPKQVTPSPAIQGGGAFQSRFEPGAGGDFDWWSSSDHVTKQGNDRTIVTLGIAFMKRELGVWGGPTPDIWEHPEVKAPLERYDVSSPWVYEMYVDQIRTDEMQTVYQLRLRLRDSIPMVYEEVIDVTIQNETHRISLIEHRNTDETGMPLEEYEPQS